MRLKKVILFIMNTMLIQISTSNDCLALMWYDPGVKPIQDASGRWRDANTNRFINVQGMPTNTTNINTKSVASGALGAVGLIAGTAGVIDSASGQQEHSWGDMLQGTVSGATAAAGGAAVINAIPVVGNISYGVAVAAGAVIGGVVSGSQLFSETDCLTDPVTGKFTCCHTQFNQGERYANIGDYMFCGVEQSEGKLTLMAPGVRQCVQGDMDNKNSYLKKEASWWDGLWKDDFWTPECTSRFCDDDAPLSGIEKYITYLPDSNKFCWNWDCIDGFKKSGNTCINNSSNSPVTPEIPGGAGEGLTEDQYDVLIKKLQNEQQRIMQLCGHLIYNQSDIMH